ncbi:hypothetical protein IU486_17485 [Streptomyces gardneri]|uniref:hypothetical protein n=1 Tax=Nocardia TaxID=1817 RepID=UPI0018947727|nr:MULTISPECIES: hypothetical protein [Nocardia]MBF6166527.1 hypothetical protein [Streptomyces gardneri]MBF6208978.1 hypothetical protein [Streptomyces gardneri]UAK36103.1 hypothetical protein K8O92_25090 [Nocardia asteroides]
MIVSRFACSVASFGLTAAVVVVIAREYPTAAAGWNSHRRVHAPRAGEPHERMFTSGSLAPIALECIVSASIDAENSL